MSERLLGGLLPAGFTPGEQAILLRTVYQKEVLQINRQQVESVLIQIRFCGRLSSCCVTPYCRDLKNALVWVSRQTNAADNQRAHRNLTAFAISKLGGPKQFSRNQYFIAL